MSYRFYMFERRDHAKHEDLANAALALCKGARQTEGITSAKFFWSGFDDIAFLIEGDNNALNAPFSGDPEANARAGFAFMDLAKQKMDIRLTDPKISAEAFQMAGR